MHEGNNLSKEQEEALRNKWLELPLLLRLTTDEQVKIATLQLQALNRFHELTVDNPFEVTPADQYEQGRIDLIKEIFGDELIIGQLRRHAQNNSDSK